MIIRKIFLFFFSLVLTFPSYAQFDLKKSLKLASFIFEGVVTKVEYKSSQETKFVKSLPHTFVTYKIKNKFKGSFNENEITLRFLGGAVSFDKKGGNGQYLSVSGIPLFDLDDHDLLFVVGNSLLFCPLINCANGRLRIFGGKVFTDSGVEILLKDEKIIFGNPIIVKDIFSHVIGPGKQNIETYTTKGKKENLNTDLNLEKSLAVDRKSFVDYLQSEVKLAFGRNRFRSDLLVLNIDIREKFFVKKLRSSQPKDFYKQADQNENDWEVKKLKANGGNPVFIN